MLLRGIMHSIDPYGSSLIVMISNGHRDAASRAQDDNSSGTSPSARLPQKRYASTSSEYSSHGFWQKTSGQMFQHAPQLTQESRPMITYMVLTEFWHSIYKKTGIALPGQFSLPLPPAATLPTVTVNSSRLRIPSAEQIRSTGTDVPGDYPRLPCMSCRLVSPCCRSQRISAFFGTGSTSGFYRGCSIPSSGSFGSC